MNIFNVAKHFDAVETLHVENNLSTKYNAQDFDYLLVLDFEAYHMYMYIFVGIKQYQVDNGVPLNTALMLFQQWLNEYINHYNLTFDIFQSLNKKCVFATWSDWDLGVCLPNECKRKRIKIADMFNKWIDVRALYRVLYYKFKLYVRRVF
ncbi:ERI1 exoribonuclease 2 [Anoplophora glabripennis]|uniref:ERI1 exoribonuclease 2 n=1 Tax=Anoplophora glabripennis TaxID=217634 RepID=UPI000C7696FA|nr:ERI1 exoribonuclease 2 [Anoplophora glabripennis]